MRLCSRRASPGHDATQDAALKALAKEFGGDAALTAAIAPPEARRLRVGCAAGAQPACLPRLYLTRQLFAVPRAAQEPDLAGLVNPAKKRKADQAREEAAKKRAADLAALPNLNPDLVAVFEELSGAQRHNHARARAETRGGPALTHWLTVRRTTNEQTLSSRKRTP